MERSQKRGGNRGRIKRRAKKGVTCLKRRRPKIQVQFRIIGLETTQVEYEMLFLPFALGPTLAVEKAEEEQVYREYRDMDYEGLV